MGVLQVFFGLVLLVYASALSVHSSNPVNACSECKTSGQRLHTSPSRLLSHGTEGAYASVAASAPSSPDDTNSWQLLAIDSLSVLAVSFIAPSASLLIDFSAPTSQPSAASEGATCSLLLTAPTVAALGSAPRCWWRSPVTVVVELGRDFTLRESDLVVVKEGVVGFAPTISSYYPPLTDDDAETVASLLSSPPPLSLPSAPALFPFPPSAPVPVTSAPAHAPLCSPLTLSARASYNSGGLALKHEWQLVSAQTSEEAAAVASYLQGLKEEQESAAGFDPERYTSTTSPLYLPTVTLPSSLFSPVAGPRVFRLTTTAWHGAAASADATVTLSSAPVPTVIVTGPRGIAVTVDRDVFIHADVSPPISCPNASVSMQEWAVVTRWELVSAPAGADPANADPPAAARQPAAGQPAAGAEAGSSQSLRIPAHSLRVTDDNDPYVFRVTATATSATSAASSGRGRSGGVGNIGAATVVEASDEVRITVAAARPRAIIMATKSTASSSTNSNTNSSSRRGSSNTSIMASTGNERITSAAGTRTYSLLAPFLLLDGGLSWDRTIPPAGGARGNAPALAAVQHRWACVAATVPGECISAADAAAVDWTAPSLRLPAAVVRRMTALAQAHVNDSDNAMPANSANNASGVEGGIELMFSLVATTTSENGTSIESIPALVSVVVVDAAPFSLSLSSSHSPLPPPWHRGKPITFTATAIAPAGAAAATAAATAAVTAEEGGPVVVWSVASGNLDLAAGSGTGAGAVLPPEAPAMVRIRSRNNTTHADDDVNDDGDDDDDDGGDNGSDVWQGELRLSSSILTTGVEYVFQASLFPSRASATAAATPAAVATVVVQLPRAPHAGLCWAHRLQPAEAEAESDATAAGATGADGAAAGAVVKAVCANWVPSAGGAERSTEDVGSVGSSAGPLAGSLQFQWFALALAPPVTASTFNTAATAGNEDTETWVELSPPLPRPWLLFSLAPGPAADGHKRRLRVVITDTATGAAAIEDIAVVVLPSSAGTATWAVGHVVSQLEQLKRHRLRSDTSTRLPVTTAVADAAATAADLEAPISSALALAAAATAAGSYSRTTQFLLLALDLLVTASTAAPPLPAAREASLRLSLIDVLSSALPLLGEGFDAFLACLPPPSFAPAEASLFLRLPARSPAAVVLLSLSLGPAAAVEPQVTVGSPQALAQGGRERVLRLLLPQLADLASHDALPLAAARAADAAAAAARRAWAAAADALVVADVALPAEGKQPKKGAQAAATAAAAEAKALAGLLQAQAAITAGVYAGGVVAGGGAVEVKNMGDDAVVTVTSALESAIPVTLSASFTPYTDSIPDSTATSTGDGVSTVTLQLPPSSLRAAAVSAGADEVDLVLTVTPDPRLLLLAGLQPGDYLDEAGSSPLVSLAVYPKWGPAAGAGAGGAAGAAEQWEDVEVAEGLVVPLRKQLDLSTNARFIAPFSALELKTESEAAAASFDGWDWSWSWGADDFPTTSHVAPLALTVTAEADEVFEVNIPHPPPADASLSCESWAYSSTTPSERGSSNGHRGWSTDGCSLVSTAADNSSSTCRCAHAGVYRVTIQHFVPRVNRLRPGDWRNLTAKNIRDHPVPLIVLCVWFAVFMIFLYIGTRIDRVKDTRALHHYHAEWRPVPGAAERAAAAAEAAAEEDRTASFCSLYGKYVGYAVRHTHMWCSVVLRDDANPFSSTGRVTAAFILILTSFMINAVFFGTKIGLKTIAKSFCAALIVLPVGTLMTYLLNTTQQGRLKHAIYGYAEHVAFLHWTGRCHSPRYATRTEHQLRVNPSLLPDDVPHLLASVARSAGWTVGPGDVPVQAEQRGHRDEHRLRQQLRLLVHVDFDTFLYWYYHWSWRSLVPVGTRLLGYALLWVWIVVCALLILVYGIRFDQMKSSNTRRWLRVSGVAIAIDIFAFKFLAILIRTFICLSIAFCRGRGPGQGRRGCLPRRGTDDDNLTIADSWDMYHAGDLEGKPRVTDGACFETPAGSAAGSWVVSRAASAETVGLETVGQVTVGQRADGKPTSGARVNNETGKGEGIVLVELMPLAPAPAPTPSASSLGGMHQHQHEHQLHGTASAAEATAEPPGVPDLATEATPETLGFGSTPSGEAREAVAGGLEVL